MAFDIFINYRTVDAAFGAAATDELLAERLGNDRFFLDNQSIAPEADHPQLLRAALESPRVLLVLIGPNWMSTFRSAWRCCSRLTSVPVPSISTA